MQYFDREEVMGKHWKLSLTEKLCLEKDCSLFFFFRYLHTVEVKWVVWCALGEKEGISCHRQQMIPLLVIPMFLEEIRAESVLLATAGSNFGSSYMFVWCDADSP